MSARRGHPDIYLENQAADALSDKVLDAGVDQAGNVQFALGQQA
jgi:iron-sulfur cluster assembly protein